MTKPEIEKKVMEVLKKELPGDADFSKSTPLGSIEEVKAKIDGGSTDALVKKILSAVGSKATATSVSIDDKTTVSSLVNMLADEMNDDKVEEAKKRKAKREEDKEKDLAEAKDDDDEEEDDKKKKKDDDDDDDDDEDLDEAKKKKAKKDDEEDLAEAKDDDDEEDDDKKKKKKDDDDDDDEENLDEAKKAKREEDKKKAKEEMMEDINSLFASEDTLTEQFKEKAALIFETALNRRIDQEVEIVKEELEESYNNNLKEAVEAHAEQLHEELDNLTGKIDEYLTYVAEEWMKENELSVEKGIRTEVTENFISGLKQLFVENYVDVPEGKEDLLESLEEKNVELENQINTHLKRNMRLKRSLQEEKRKNIIFEATQELSLAEREQLSELAESVDFEDEQEFGKKVQILKEHYFAENDSSAQKSDMIEDEQQQSQTLTEDYHAEKQPVSAIDIYKNAISSFNRF